MRFDCTKLNLENAQNVVDAMQAGGVLFSRLSDGNTLLRPLYAGFPHWSGHWSITFTRMFEPRHNIHSNVRKNVGKYVVTWLEYSRESNRPVPGPLLAELCILIRSRSFDK